MNNEANSNATTVTLTVTLGPATFRPVVTVADNGVWSIDDDGLEDAVSREDYSDWLVTLWGLPEMRPLRRRL